VRSLLHRKTVALALANRQRKWELYQSRFPPRAHESVLDVGVSRYDDYPGENYFLGRYPYPDQLTGVGIDDLGALQSRYPGVRLVQADGRDLPFEDDAFDAVHSNAVVEHVGPREEQAHFIAELVRVARAGFVTTPSRWFPLEVHTRAPFVHWLPRPAASWSLEHMGRIGRGRYASTWDTWPLSARAFRSLFPDSVTTECVAQRVAGWPATITILFWKR
jgi:hypothetical protein